MLFELVMLWFSELYNAGVFRTVYLIMNDLSIWYILVQAARAN